MADSCADLVREYDRDRYIATLFAPDDKRDDLFALYAFALELARIPALVSEPQIGEIRLQWWFDTVDAIAQGHTVDHPVASAFGYVVQQHALPVEHIETMIDARRDDLYADQFPSLIDLEAHIAETEALVMQFACMVLDREAAGSSGALVGLAATAFGLARLAAREKLDAKYIPPGETIETIKSLAKRRLREARELHLPKMLLPALLPAALTEAYFKGQPSQLKSQWLLWRAARRQKI
jgi:15-cis-phytoene synthase